MGNFQIPCVAYAKQKAFVGLKEGALDEEEYVYVTEHGQVYHTNPACSHIQLSIVPYSQVQKGTKKPCHWCGRGSPSYVALSGDCWHGDLNCSSITRTIEVKKKSEIGGVRLCTRCAASIKN